MAKALPRVSRKGYDLAGDAAQILLLHGYTGSPYDLRPLGDFLHHRGCHVVALLLKGHGTKPYDLNYVHAEDWLKQATTALRGFDHKRPIIVAGLSMGALLAILLTDKLSFIDGLVLISPALKLTRSAEITIASVKLGLIDLKSSIKKLSGGSDILDPVARKKCPSYKEMPIFGLMEFEKLRVLAKEKLSDIPCPIFMAFGKQDGAINVSESHRMILETSHQPIFSKVYENSKHVITLDYDREQLYLDIWHFLTNRLGI